MDELEAEIAGQAAQLESRRFEAVHRLRWLEEQRARRSLGIGERELVSAVRERVEAGLDQAAARAAALQLLAAEGWQREIGSWATGSGEGLSSMRQVRMLQAARAWLCDTLGERDQALALAAEVRDDPNGSGNEFLALLPRSLGPK